MIKLLLINPLSSQKFLSEQLKKYNIYTTALFTKLHEEFSNYVAPDKSYFDQQVYVKQDSSFDQIIASIPDMSFDFILNGTDESLTLTEMIITKLKPELANLPELSYSRVNKFSMQEQFRVAGLPYIRQVRADLADMATLDVDNLWFPCILKPVLGAASIGVFLCGNKEELISNMMAANKLLTLMSEPIDKYIIQEVIYGQEIFVDTFSTDGVHYVSAIHTIYKETIGDSVACYRYEVLIDSQDIWSKSANLVKAALDACGFRNGFNHTELFLLSDGSFRIIEINPRISGAKGMPNRLTQLQGLHTQVDLLVQHLNHAPITDSTLSNAVGYAKLLYLYNFTDTNTCDIGISLSSKLKLESDYEVIMCSIINSIPEKIKNLTNVDAMVLLYSRNRAIVERDVNLIFALEKFGNLFDFVIPIL
jgi:biotin carboxylase